MPFYPLANYLSFDLCNSSLLILPRCAYGPEFPTVQCRCPKLPRAVPNRKENVGSLPSFPAADPTSESSLSADRYSPHGIWDSLSKKQSISLKFSICCINTIKPAMIDNPKRFEHLYTFYFSLTDPDSAWVLHASDLSAIELPGGFFAETIVNPCHGSSFVLWLNHLEKGESGTIGSCEKYHFIMKYLLTWFLVRTEQTLDCKWVRRATGLGHWSVLVGIHNRVYQLRTEYEYGCGCYKRSRVYTDKIIYQDNLTYLKYVKLLYRRIY